MQPILGGDVAPDYAVWDKAFGIVDGENLETRLNVLEPGCVRTSAENVQ
jgi:hypothetical protein